MAYLKNSVVDFTDRQVDTYIVEDYFTFDLKKILDHVASCTEDFFEYYQMQDDDKLERVALELYGNANYWDILLLINGKDALFDLPYNFDTLASFAEEKAKSYAVEVSELLTLSDAHVAQMQEIYEEKNRVRNEEMRIVRIVKPTRMQEFIQKAYEAGCFV
jgi:hypothetical protein